MVKPENGQRISKADTYLNCAEVFAYRSTCIKRKYGAVIVKDDVVISTGYNGSPRGFENCCDAGKCPRMALGLHQGEGYGMCRAIHAEANALLNCSRQQTIGADLYLTGINPADNSIHGAKPCPICARTIIQAGIRNVCLRVGEGADNYITVPARELEWVQEAEQSAAQESGRRTEPVEARREYLHVAQQTEPAAGAAEEQMNMAGAGATAVGMRKETVCRKEFSGIGLRVLLGGIAIYGAQIAAQYLLMNLPLPQAWIENINFWLAFGIVLPMYVIGFPIAFLIMKSGGDRRTIEKKHMGPLQFLVAFLISYVFLWAGNLIGLVVTAGIGTLKGAPVSNDLNMLISEVDIRLLVVYAVLIGPVFEELFLRKMLCDRVIKYGQGTAILLSALLFGLFHGNFNQFFYACFIGGFLAFIYVKTGNVKYTIGIHMMINFIGSVPGALLLKKIDLQNLSLETLTGPSIILLALYILLIYAILIAGFVLLMINRSRLKTEAGEITLEKKERTRIVFGNAGMILCIVCFGLMMLTQAFLG